MGDIQTGWAPIREEQWEPISSIKILCSKGPVNEHIPSPHRYMDVNEHIPSPHRYMDTPTQNDTDSHIQYQSEKFP